MVAVAAYDRMRETHVHDDSCCLTIGIGKLQPALSRKLPRNLAEQGISCLPSWKLDFRRWEGVNVMEPMKWALQALDIIESETRDLVPAEAPSTPKSETDVEIAPLVQQVGATSIAEIEKMIGELQEAKDFLQSEGERVQRETEHYTTLTQMASASLKIISDTVAKWREAGHPLRNHSTSTQFEVTPFPPEDGTGSEGVPNQPSQSQGQIRARTRRKNP
jgi:hypothetical protein